MQVPIGLEEDFKGLVDLVQLKAYYFQGSSGSVSKDKLFTRFFLMYFFFSPYISNLLYFMLLHVLVKRLLLKKFLQI